MKKLLALMLSVALILSMSTGVMAYSDVEEGTYVSEAVSVLSDFGVFNGFEDGSFQPEVNVTRAQMAKVICEMLGYNKIAVGATDFTDVPSNHWASGYINTIQGLGIINGYGDGTYGPEDVVSYEQAIKMIVCALGYEPMAASKGGWSAGYMSVAASIGLLDGANGATRGDIAVLVYNALNTPVMEQTSFGSESRYEVLDGTGNRGYKTLLTEKDIYKATGLVGEVVTDEVVFTITQTSDDKKFEVNEVKSFVIGDSNIRDYTYQEVEVYVLDDNRDYTILAVKPAQTTETFTLISDDISDIKVASDGEKYHVVEYYVGSKTKKIQVAKDALIEYNKNADSGKTIADFIDVEDIELVFVDNNGDGKYDVVVATEYTSERLEMVDSYREKIILGGKTVIFDFEDENKTYIFVDEKGNTIDLSDFKEDDVIAYIADARDIRDADYLKIVKLSSATVYGEVEEVNKIDSSIVINGYEYKVASNIWDEVAAPGVEGVFYIGITDKIIYFDGSSVATKYGYILAAGDSNTTFDKTIQVKLLTAKGVDIYNLTNKAALEFSNICNSNYVFDWDIAATQSIDTNRFVEYVINSKGEISKIKLVGTVSEFNNVEYNADTEILNGKFIDEDTMIFVINEDKAEDTFVTNSSYLVDEGVYSGATYVKYGDTKVVFITDTDTAYNSEMGFAIVTNISKMVDDNGDDVLAVKYFQNEKAGTVYFEAAEVNEEDFVLGTVFVFNVLDTGFVNKYSIIASVDTEDYDFVEVNSDGLGSDVEVVFGYIYNTTRKTNTRGELITLDNGETYVITSKTNKYTYVDSARKDNIKIEDFLAGNAYYRDEETNEMTAVMLKLVDGVVVDIYTISD